MYFIIVSVPHRCICEGSPPPICLNNDKQKYRIMYNKQHNNCNTIVIFFTTNKLAIASIHGKYVCMYR